MKRSLSLVLMVFLFASIANAQKTAEVTISLNEQFFDVLLDAVFTNLKTPSVPLASNEDGKKGGKGNGELVAFQEVSFDFGNQTIADTQCDESIKLQREIDGVRTSVRFRQGKIYAPIAFRGNYNPPLIGCIGFQGYAETNIELEFDQQTQTLVGRAKVTNVVLSGTGGIGSSLLTRLVQSSIDDKINPLKILDMNKVSFTVPVQNSGSLRMKAVGMRHNVGEGVLNVVIKYQFLKG